MENEKNINHDPLKSYHTIIDALTVIQKEGWDISRHSGDQPKPNLSHSTVAKNYKYQIS